MDDRMNIKNKEIFMLYPKISHNKTGIVVSMLRRAELLANYGYKVNLLTLDYDVNTRENFEKLFSDEILTNRKNIQCINIFSFYQKKSQDYYCSMSAKPSDDVDYDENQNRIYRNRQGRIKRYEVFKDKKLTHINFFKDRVIASRNRYDDYGKLCSYQILENKCITMEHFFDIYGKIVLTLFYSYKEDKRVVQNIHLYDEYGMIEESFESLIELFNYTLEKHLCTDATKKYLILIDKIKVFAPILHASLKDNIYIFGTIHAAHYSDPQNILGAPNKNYIPYFKNLDRLAGLVILTERQRQDIEALYGEHQAYTTIPHALAYTPQEYHLAPQPYKFISLARYDKVKRLDLLIEIFEKVVQHYPQATLDLHGYGLEYSNLEKIIQDKSLQNNIFLKPFVQNVNVVLQEASMLLLTTRSESFCLVVMEALANGCPVTSFDIRYGPSEMIRHGENGYLIPDGSVEQYSQQILDYLSDHDNMYKMRQQAKKLSYMFKGEHVIEKWVKLFESVDQNYPRYDIDAVS